MNKEISVDSATTERVLIGPAHPDYPGYPVMRNVLRPSVLGTLPTIVFLNKSFEKPEPTVWICATPEVARARLADLKASPHIEVLSVNDSLVMWE